MSATRDEIISNLIANIRQKILIINKQIQKRECSQLPVTNKKVQQKLKNLELDKYLLDWVMIRMCVHINEHEVFLISLKSLEQEYKILMDKIPKNATEPT